MDNTQPRVGFARNWARRVISDHQITRPPVDVVAIASSEGLQVKLIETWPTKVSGLLLCDSRLIGINANHVSTRRRFSLAHELGHWFMRHDLQWHDRDVTIDNPPLPLDDTKDPIEKEANEFAAELLAPLAMLKVSFGTVNDPDRLADLYDMSPPAMWIHLMKHRLI